MGCYSSADGRVDKMRLQTPEDGPDPNAPRFYESYTRSTFTFNSKPF